MRYLIVALAFLAVAAGCKKAEKAAEAAKEVQQAPVKYVNDLQKDMQKAEAVADKANANPSRWADPCRRGEPVAVGAKAGPRTQPAGGFGRFFFGHPRVIITPDPASGDARRAGRRV